MIGGNIGDVMSYANRFMCVCSPKEWLECHSVMKEVEELFVRPKRDDIIDKNGWNLTAAHSDAGLMTNAVYWAESQDKKYLEWNFAADQWCGVGCVEYLWDNENKKYSDKPNDTVFFQCDVVEHGIAACIKYYEDKWNN